MCFRGCLATGCWSLLVIACVTLVTVDYVVQHQNPVYDCFSTLLCLSVVSIEDLSLCLLANTHKLQTTSGSKVNSATQTGNKSHLPSK